MLVDPSFKIGSYGGSSPSKIHCATSSTASERHRRGTMFVEVAIGIALAIVVMIAVAQLVAVVATQRREVGQSRQATREVANLMERVMVLPWSELTTEAVTRFEVSGESAATLDDPQLAITVSNFDDTRSTKQIEITLSWRDLANRRVEPVRLVAWKYHPTAAE